MLGRFFPTFAVEPIPLQLLLKASFLPKQERSGPVFFHSPLPVIDWLSICFASLEYWLFFLLSRHACARCARYPISILYPCPKLLLFVENIFRVLRAFKYLDLSSSSISSLTYSRSLDLETKFILLGNTPGLDERIVTRGAAWCEHSPSILKSKN
jgi:hypothetical protein